MRKILLVVMLMFIATPIFARGATIAKGFEKDDFVPAPRLIAPTTEMVNLTGKKNLQFKWSAHEGDASKRQYYDFRLYKGYDMVQSALVFKERVPARQFNVILESNLFEDDHIYTWSVRQIYDGVRRSRRSTHSFKAIKK